VPDLADSSVGLVVIPPRFIGDLCRNAPHSRARRGGRRPLSLFVGVSEARQRAGALRRCASRTMVVPRSAPATHAALVGAPVSKRFGVAHRAS
jgi:hypothetical protein